MVSEHSGRLPLPLQPVAAVGLATRWVFRRLRRFVYSVLSTIGGMAILCVRIAALAPVSLRHPGFTIRQCMDLGVSSLPLIFITGIFIGMVSAISAEYQFQDMVPLRYLGMGVTQLVFLELGPVITALVMSGRIGSSIAAQIGSMKEREEIDAMQVMALDPLRYLAAPRIFTGFFMMPVLTTIACFLAILGAWGTAVLLLDVTSYTFTSGMRLFFRSYIVFVCLVKASVFGSIISLLGYYHGTTAAGGAKGVGEATMKSVVSSSVMILMFDFLITYILLF